jgi:hypothetical protein
MLLPRPIVHVFLLLVSTTSMVCAVDLEEMPEYRAVRQALHDGLHSVAALKAARLMEAAAPHSTERKTLASLAVEASVRAGDGRTALKILQSEKVPNADFWTAQAHVQAGELDTAEKLLIRRVRDETATGQERFLLAQVSLVTGSLTQAREILEPLRSSPDPHIAARARHMWDEVELRTGHVEQALADLTQPGLPLDDKARLLLAQALLEAGRQSEAQKLLRELVSSAHGGERVHHAASILLADSLLRENNQPQAVEALVQFLDNTAESDLWSSAFDLLARCLGRKSDVPPPDATLRWIAEGNAAQRAALTAPATTALFQGHAMLLLARWLTAQDRNFEALGLLEAQLQIHAGHPQMEGAMQLALETYSAGKADARVAALTDMWRQRFGANGSSLIEFITAGTAYSRGDYPRAAELFQTAANLATTLAERRSALFNAGVSALRAGELALYHTLLSQLQVVSGDTSADLELDRALELASRAQPEAEAELRSFAQKHPQHPRLFEAQIALSEVLLLRVPIDFAAADRALKSAESIPSITDKQRERLLLTRLWRLDRQGLLKELAEVGASFLKDMPAASQAVLIRLKVADAYFRLENFAAARTEFELVAKEFSSSPHADTALYFAGMSALSMMSDEGRETAISLWQELAERGGPLSVPARQQQAMAKRRAGQEAEALTLLDSLLSEKKLAKDLRRSLVCDKAEILMVLGKSDITSLTSAIALLQEFLRDADLPFEWRARGGYTLAVALNSAGRDSEALEASYDVVQAIGYAGPSEPAEFRWYYRAGFFGIDLLERAKQWEPAARLAEKLAVTSGDRAAEAKERATKIRLEHFLWDGK